MAKTNKEAIVKLCNQINKKEGEGTIYTIGSKKANLNIKRWATGIEDLDAIIGGGMPEGRVVEIFGAESSGKTTLLYHLCGLHQLCLDIPVEGCVDKDTEFFNGKEWKPICEYKEGEKVLQFNNDGTMEMVEPLKYWRYASGELQRATDEKGMIDMVLSPFHNVALYDSVDNSYSTTPLIALKNSSFPCSSVGRCLIPVLDSIEEGTGISFIEFSRLKWERYKTLDGYMYCFTMPSGMWVMRRNNKIIVTGNTFDAERAKVFGNRPKQMLIYRAKYGEDAFNKTIQFSKAGIPLIGIDSVPSLVPKEDAEKVLKSAEKDSIEEQRIGGTARLINKYLPTIEEIIEVTGTTLIFVNQVRDKMNAMLFGEKTDTPGGRKLKHAASLRIQVARKSWIEIPNKDPHNSATNKKVGLIMKCKVVKSKVCNPMGECEIPLFFDRGFVSFEDVPTIRKELMRREAEKFGKRVPKEFLGE